MYYLFLTHILVEEGDYEGSGDQSGASILEEESAVASSSSVGPQPEIDAKLADFFNVRNLNKRVFFSIHENYRTK